MLANRIRRSVRPFKQRFFSQTYPFPKLRAFPFKFSPADAIVHMAPHASALFMFKGFFRSLAARFLPRLGYQPLQPTRIIPVYFPVWIIDAEIEVDFSYGNHDTQRRSIVGMLDSYLPGSDFKVLSLVPLLSRPRKSSDAVPFTDELRYQYGTEVSCLPYTISPFAALDMASSLSPMDAKVDDDLRFIPTSITPNLLAAYPVLVPLYLAHYEYTLPGIGLTRSCTMFIEAYKPKGRIMAEQFGPLSGKELRQLLPRAPSAFMEFTHMVDNIPVATLRGMPNHFINIVGLLTPERRDLTRKVLLWLESFLSTPGTATTLASESSALVSVEDVRVREYTREERYAAVSWIKLGAELASVKMLAETMANSEAPAAIGPDSGKIMEGALNSLKSKIDALEAKRTESVPIWWKKWRETSGDAQRSPS